MTIADAPRTETGYPGGVVPAYTAGMGHGYILEDLDLNVDLRFPASAVVYDRMGHEDGQVVSVVRAIAMAIASASRTLVGDDVRPEVKSFITGQLGLDLNEGRARRRRRGIVHRRHRREAAVGVLRYGFMPFEQTYDVGPANPGQLPDPERDARVGTQLYAHLSRLNSRNPRTLMEVRVTASGSLVGIVQEPRPGTVAPYGVFIPAEQLVMYVNEQEGADWTGNSALRGAYKHWLIKDALIRVGAQVVERNGMGIPVVEHDQGYRGQALQLARALRAGSESGATLERGKMSLTLMGVTGNVVDGLPWVKYHDEAIGRSLLAMVLNLGHDGGLGSATTSQTFADLLADYINSINTELDEVDTEHIIRDLVELNYGPDEPYPVLRTEDVTAESTPTAEALKFLKESGLLTYDPALEADIRRRYTLPAMPPPPPGDAGLEDATTPVAEVGIPALITAGVIDAEEARVMLKLPPGAPEPDPTVVGSVIATRGPSPQAGDASDQGGVILPAAMASALSAHRDAIRVTLGLSSGDPLLDAATTLTDRIAALRAGHGA